MKIIDNFDVFPWEFVKGEFYFIQLIIRGKDHKGKPGVNGSNHARTVREYTVGNQAQLDKYMPEMREIADAFGARIYMRPTRRNYKKVAAYMIQLLGEYLYKDVHKLGAIYSGAVGKDLGVERMWIVDVDDNEEKADEVIAYINTQMPLNVVQYKLPTKNGRHIITKPFDRREFGEKYSEIDIHKNNPTLLYC